MATRRALIQLPQAVRRGQVFEVRTLVGHAMETGYRRDSDGRLLPRDILRRMDARFAGEPVFAADLHPAIAANPFIAFSLVVQQRGVLEVRWSGDNGFEHTESVTIDPA